MDKDFRYYFETEGAIFELPQAPQGYEDTTANYKRDMNYWGVIRSFSFPLKFVLAGGRYLKKVLRQRGVDAIVVLRVDRLDYPTQQYITIYKGELDLSKAEDDITGVTVPLMDGDLQSKIKAYERTPFEYSLDAGVDVNLFGTDFSDLITIAGSGAVSFAVSKILKTEIISENVETGAFQMFNQIEEEFINSAGMRVVDFTTSTNNFIVSPAGTTVTLRGNINANFKNFGTNIRQFYYVGIASSQSANGDPFVRLLSTGDFQGSGQYFNINFNIDTQLVLQAGVKYFLVLYSRLNSSVDSNFTINSMSLDVSRAGTTESTIIKAFRPKDLYEKIINSIRPSTEAMSDLLTNFDFLITSGDAIRGLPDPKLKTSWADFYKSINAVLCTGFSSHANKAVLENRGFFFRDSYRVADLDNIKDLKMVPFDEIMFSNIKAGYPNVTYDNDRGREEFNQPQNWQTPSYRSQKDLDIMSVYRADQFGIEELLKKNFDQTANETNTDSRGDNDVFILWVKKVPVNGVYQLKTARDFDSVSGVSDRSYTYNIDLSPKRNVIRHLDFIKSGFWGVNENGYLIMSSAQKNAELSTVEGGLSIVEREPIYLADYNKRVLIPFLVTFKTNYNRSIKEIIDTSPEGFIRFKWGNYYFSAYIYEIKIDLAKNSDQEFTLILSKDNNLENLQ